MTDLLEALGAAVGDAVSTDAAALDAARTDKSGHRSGGSPIAVVSARSVADVQSVMRLATEHRTAVVPRGAGTGLAGGATAGSGEIVLSTLAMDRVLEVSVADELAEVEPGIINAALNVQLAASGLWFAPDPASRAISTVGGNIATNAGGLLCAKYGVTRESVLALDVVLADGRLISTGHRTIKGVTGLDLTALMIGSEGTLGVIVGATLKLRPLVRGVTATLASTFADVTAAAAASASITAAGLRPAVMEIVDANALRLISAHLELPLHRPGAAHLLVQTDGAAAELEMAAVLRLVESLGGEAEVTTDADEGERLLAIRRAFHGAVDAVGTALIEDVAVPRSALPQMFAAIADVERRYGIIIPTVAHAGDGNLHPNFIVDRALGDTVPDEIWEAAGELFAAAIALGGTLTGEHGVGVLKRRWIGQELGDDQLDLQRGIKAVFDPLGILNPGKVF